tara:strand:+ start:475 stop:1014 length:540 start_codon:yes stop_codon:yes gene_type:complete
MSGSKPKKPKATQLELDMLRMGTDRIASTKSWADPMAKEAAEEAATVRRDKQATGIISTDVEQALKGGGTLDPAAPGSFYANTRNIQRTGESTIGSMNALVEGLKQGNRARVGQLFSPIGYAMGVGNLAIKGLSMGTKLATSDLLTKYDAKNQKALDWMNLFGDVARTAGKMSTDKTDT